MRFQHKSGETYTLPASLRPLNKKEREKKKKKSEPCSKSQASLKVEQEMEFFTEPALFFSEITLFLCIREKREESLWDRGSIPFCNAEEISEVPQEYTLAKGLNVSATIKSVFQSRKGTFEENSFRSSESRYPVQIHDSKVCTKAGCKKENRRSKGSKNTQPTVKLPFTFIPHSFHWLNKFWRRRPNLRWC